MKKYCLALLALSLSCFPLQAWGQENTTTATPAEQGWGLGEAYFFLNWNLAHDLNDEWGIQVYHFRVGIPQLNTGSDYVYFGPYYKFNQYLNLGLTAGYSFNFPDKKSLPLVALNAWGQITEPLSYYLEVDSIGTPQAWFYMAKLNYQIDDAVSVGLWGLGFGEGQQELQVAPYARWATQIGPVNLGMMGAAFVSNRQKIHPTVMFDAYF